VFNTNILVVTAVVEIGLFYLIWIRSMTANMTYQARAEGRSRTWFGR